MHGASLSFILGGVCDRVLLRATIGRAQSNGTKWWYGIINDHDIMHTNN